MRFYRTAILGAAACLLLTCPSCRLSDFDANGDGTVTRDEIVSAIVDSVCGDSTDTPASDGSSTDGSGDNSSSDNQGNGSGNGSTDDAAQK